MDFPKTLMDFPALRGAVITIKFDDIWFLARNDQANAILMAILVWKFGMRTMGGHEDPIYVRLFGKSVITKTPFSVRFTVEPEQDKPMFEIMSGDGQYHPVMLEFNQQLLYKLPQIYCDSLSSDALQECVYTGEYTRASV